MMPPKNWRGPVCARCGWPLRGLPRGVFAPLGPLIHRLDPAEAVLDLPPDVAIFHACYSAQARELARMNSRRSYIPWWERREDD